jgi:putative transposase
VVGIDRGVSISAALSTGEMLTVPRLSSSRKRRLRHLQRKLARAEPNSNRRAQVKRAIAKLRAREADTRRDWTEKPLRIWLGGLTLSASKTCRSWG